MRKQIIVNARFLTQNISGVQRYGMEMAKQLKRHYPDAVFVSPQNILHQDLARELGVIKIGYFSGHLWEQIELPLHIKKKYPDSLLLNFCNPAPLIIKNQIVTIHDVSFLVNKKWFSFPFRAWYGFMIPFTGKRALKVLTVSEFSKNELVRYTKIDPVKIGVIPNACAEIFRQQPLATKSPYILSVSSLDPRKNLSTVISAFSIVSKKYPGIKLILAGSAHKAFSSEVSGTETVDLSQIHFTGYVSDPELADLYRNASVFVYMSLYEGFGIPPIEAMSAGCPVVVSDIESLRETCGNAAVYCHPLNPVEIAGTLIKKLQEEITEEDVRLYQQQADLYSWEKSARKLLLIIEELI